MKNQIIITLGREHGSGGHYIADMIAQELGIKLYDKDSIEKEIVSEGYSEEMIRKMDEKPVNFFASRRIGKYSNSLEVNVAEKTFAMLRDKAANGESFLIIGRCGDQVLMEHPTALLVLMRRLFTWRQIPRMMAMKTLLLESIAEHPTLSARERGDLLGECDLIESFLCYNDISAMSRLHRSASAQMSRPAITIRSGGGWTFGSPSVLMMFHRRPGDLDKELAEMDECMPHYYKVTGGHGQGAETIMRAEADLQQGRFDDAQILLERAYAQIEGNGQTELVYGLTGLEKISSGKITLDGKDITRESIRQRSKDGMSHIPEDRHKHGLVLDFTLEQNMVLQRYKEPQFQHGGFIRRDAVRAYADRLIEQFDVRSGQGAVTIARSMSGGNQQKAIIAREVDRDKPLIIAVQPTRGLDVGAIEYIHKQLVAQRDAGKAVLLVSLELDEVMSLSDRILVMYEGQIVGELDPKQTTVQELGLYMSGAKCSGKDGESA